MPAAQSVRRMTFDQINSELLTDHHRTVLKWALEKGSLCSESFYFGVDLDGKLSDAWRSMCSWDLFFHPRGADPARTLTSWRLTRMGAALAHHIAKQKAA